MKWRWKPRVPPLDPSQMSLSVLPSISPKNEPDSARFIISITWGCQVRARGCRGWMMPPSTRRGSQGAAHQMPRLLLHCQQAVKGPRLEFLFYLIFFKGEGGRGESGESPREKDSYLSVIVSISRRVWAVRFQSAPHADTLTLIWQRARYCVDAPCWISNEWWTSISRRTGQQ